MHSCIQKHYNYIAMYMDICFTFDSPKEKYLKDKDSEIQVASISSL